MPNCYAFGLAHSPYDGNGRGGIRTHGGFPHARFRVECLKPDSATLPLGEKKTPNVERPTFNIECNCLRDSAFSVGRWTFSVVFQPVAWLAPIRLADRIFCLTRPKNVTIKRLPCLASLLHLVYPHGQPRYYLLLTGIHRFLAPLFTSIANLFGTSTLPYRHDSTQTRNSARVTK